MAYYQPFIALNGKFASIGVGVISVDRALDWARHHKQWIGLCLRDGLSIPRPTDDVAVVVIEIEDLLRDERGYRLSVDDAKVVFRTTFGAL